MWTISSRRCSLRWLGKEVYRLSLRISSAPWVLRDVAVEDAEEAVILSRTYSEVWVAAEPLPSRSPRWVDLAEASTSRLAAWEDRVAANLSSTTKTRTSRNRLSTSSIRSSVACRFLQAVAAVLAVPNPNRINVVNKVRLVQTGRKSST